MKEVLQQGSYLHPYAFRRYCLYVVRLHPSTERRSGADLVCALQLHEQQQKLLALAHQGFRPLSNDLGRERSAHEDLNHSWRRCELLGRSPSQRSCSSHEGCVLRLHAKSCRKKLALILTSHRGAGHMVERGPFSPPYRRGCATQAVTAETEPTA